MDTKKERTTWQEWTLLFIGALAVIGMVLALIAGATGQAAVGWFLGCTTVAVVCAIVAWRQHYHRPATFREAFTLLDYIRRRSRH